MRLLLDQYIQQTKYNINHHHVHHCHYIHLHDHQNVHHPYGTVEKVSGETMMREKAKLGPGMHGSKKKLKNDTRQVPMWLDAGKSRLIFQGKEQTKILQMESVWSDQHPPHP